MQIVLASASPRRRQLMEMLDLPDLTVIPAQGAEVPPAHAEPGELVPALSAAKARAVAALVPDGALVVGADTIVWVDGRPFGKPHSEVEAAQMLRTLSGRAHEVYTGVTLIRSGEELSEWERSRVFFRSLSPEEISRYVATGEPMDKAGAYGAQGLGALLVERIEGDFFNVMGLPLCHLGQMFKKLGVEIL